MQMGITNHKWLYKLSVRLFSDSYPEYLVPERLLLMRACTFRVE